MQQGTIDNDFLRRGQTLIFVEFVDNFLRIYLGHGGSEKFSCGEAKITQSMYKLQLTEPNLCRVFNFRSGHLHTATFLVLSVKLPNLQLKTRPKPLLGSLPLAIGLPA